MRRGSDRDERFDRAKEYATALIEAIHNGTASSSLMIASGKRSRSLTHAANGVDYLLHIYQGQFDLLGKDIRLPLKKIC